MIQHENPVYTSPVPRTIYIPRQSHPSRSYRPHNTAWGAQIMKIFIMRFASTGVLPPRNTHLAALSLDSHTNLYNHFLFPHAQPIVYGNQMTRPNHADHHYVIQMLATYLAHRMPLLFTVSGVILELHKPRRFPLLVHTSWTFRREPGVLPPQALFFSFALYLISVNAKATSET
jgi:hypothetical protein